MVPQVLLSHGLQEATLPLLPLFTQALQLHLLQYVIFIFYSLFHYANKLSRIQLMHVKRSRHLYFAWILLASCGQLECSCYTLFHCNYRLHVS